MADATTAQRSATEPGTKDPERRTTRARVADVLERSGVPILLLLLIALFAAAPATGVLFRTTANVQNIFANQSVTGLIAIGMVIPLVAGYFDLSVPAIAGVSNVMVAALLATHHQPIWLGLVVGILAGLVAGAVNGVLVALLRLSPFIVTLGTYILLSGLLLAYTGGETIISGMPPQLGQWGAGRWIGIARPFWLLIIASLIVWFLITQTPFGRKLAAIGSNENAARLAGIRVDRSIFITFLLSGLLGGMAGAVLTIRSGGGDATSAVSYLFPAFAALFLGQTAITPGRPNVWGTVFGVFLVSVAVNGFTLLGAQSWVSQVFNGTVLVLSVATSTLIARSRERRAKAIQMEAMRG
ncbi:ABC transporter permease [Streptomyces carpinensis]|uniref:ABC transporter permease n=1 Tax=Streptomyces carpinensis TaxID=66369 RepID=A0ABV1VUS9_9ACTN|nr:ABC transporter permease [Streptomyces carpinensis]